MQLDCSCQLPTFGDDEKDQLQPVATALCKQYIYGRKPPILQANFGLQWVLRGVKLIFLDEVWHK